MTFVRNAVFVMLFVALAAMFATCGACGVLGLGAAEMAKESAP